MRKLFSSLLFLLVFSFKAQALGVADIPTMNQIAEILFQDASQLLGFTRKLRELSDLGFIVVLPETGDSLTITAQQKANLVLKYQALKTQLQADAALLP